MLMFAVILCSFGAGIFESMRHVDSQVSDLLQSRIMGADMKTSLRLLCVVVLTLFFAVQSNISDEVLISETALSKGFIRSVMYLIILVSFGSGVLRSAQEATKHLSALLRKRSQRADAVKLLRVLFVAILILVSATKLNFNHEGSALEPMSLKQSIANVMYPVILISFGARAFSSIGQINQLSAFHRLGEDVVTLP